MSHFANRGRALTIAAVAIATLVVPTLSHAASSKVRVMTRNIYLGADLTPALTAPTNTELFERAGATWRAVQDTNFTARAKRIAAEIENANSHFVGLQEVALWRRDDFGIPDGPATPATEVVYDFLDSLDRELDRLGLDYRASVIQNEADFEIPLDFVDDDAGPPVWDGRLTIRDVILVKRGANVEVQRKRSGNFAAETPIDLPPEGPSPNDITIKRGWTAVDAKVRGARVRVANTHLEAFSALVRNLQAGELAGTDGPLDVSRPVVLLGDLNSDPDDPDAPDQVAYNTFIGAGFVDRGVSVDTCCHAPNLLNPAAAFDERIDHVLSRPLVRRDGASLVGADPALRTPHGLWPSDHGGVASRLRVRR